MTRTTPQPDQTTIEGDAYYWEEDAKVERGEYPPNPACPVLAGHEARATSRQQLMWATDTDSLEAAIAVALGRPRLSAEPNETVKVRTPRPLAEGLRQIARQQGVTLSQVARTAWAEFLERHQLASPADPSAA